MIVIAGDSWGEGQWIDTPTGPGPRWPGFHYYWTQRGVDALNLSYGGYSNHQAVSALDMYFQHKNCYSENQVIIWMTCVLRDYPKNITVKDIDVWTQQHYHNVFDRLITISQLYNNCSISILGGLGDIPRSFPLQLAPNVRILLHSTAQFLNPSYSIESPYGHSTLAEIIPNIDQRHRVFLDLEKKFDYMQSEREIYPDGGHFGRESYQKIYNYVQPKI